MRRYFLRFTIALSARKKAGEPQREYNRLVARGWESKSVEDQQAAASTQVESKQRLTPEQLALRQERESLQLSRRRIVQQLQSVQNPRHRQMLESALSDLDSRLARTV